jgi:PERQ amino acid-rich with GYF domain-containing protein
VNATQQNAAHAGVYVPPHLHSNRNGNRDNQYSRERLFEIYGAQRDAQGLSDGVSDLFAEGWAPNVSNGTSSTVWGRRDDQNKDFQYHADVCWQTDGILHALGQEKMSAEEEDVSDDLIIACRIQY